MKKQSGTFKIITLCLGLALSLSSMACGDSGNLFEEASDSGDGSATQKDEAIQAIENEDWTLAQQRLEQLVNENPQDQEVRAMLANVYMKQSGVDSLEISKDVDEASDEKGSISVPAMIKALPEASEENLANLKKSVETFNTIPIEDMTAAQKLQKAMAEFSYAIVLTKKVSADEEGNFDSTKTANMAEEDAEDIVAMMDISAATIAAVGGEQYTKGAEKIAKTTESIKAQEGETIADKLSAYLAAEAAKQ